MTTPIMADNHWVEFTKVHSFKLKSVNLMHIENMYKSAKWLKKYGQMTKSQTVLHICAILWYCNTHRNWYIMHVLQGRLLSQHPFACLYHQRPTTTSKLRSGPNVAQSSTKQQKESGDSSPIVALLADDQQTVIPFCTNHQIPQMGANEKTLLFWCKNDQPMRKPSKTRPNVGLLSSDLPILKFASVSQWSVWDCDSTETKVPHSMCSSIFLVHSLWGQSLRAAFVLKGLWARTD